MAFGDVTITRAHIAAAQADRAKKARDPLTPEQLVAAFVRFPEQRHMDRAVRLMLPRRNKETA